MGREPRVLYARTVCFLGAYDANPLKGGTGDCANGSGRANSVAGTKDLEMSEAEQADTHRRSCREALTLFRVGSRIRWVIETGLNSSDSTIWNGYQGKILCQFINGREPLKMRGSVAFQQILFHFVLPHRGASHPLEWLRQLSANALLELFPIP